MTIPPGWSTQKLAEFLVSITAFTTEASAALGAVERVAESLEAEVAAIVQHGELVAAIGYPAGAAPVAELDAVARGARLELTVPGDGLRPATVVPLEHPPDASLVVARSGPGSWSREEAGLLQGMARVTSMALRMQGLLDEERASRKESQRQVAENVRLVSALTERQEQLERLAAEQAAMRRVATLVARGVSPEEVFAAVAEEIGRIFPTNMVQIDRYGGDGAAVTVAAWSNDTKGVEIGTPFATGGHDVSTIVLRTGRSARIDDGAQSTGSPAAVDGAHGASAVGSPIVVDGRLWGVMIAVATTSDAMPADAEERLAGFTELTATAIANAHSRAELRASRARVVEAADEARRRLERDLHDGTQQRLVSLALELRTAEAMVPRELVELKAELSHTARGLAAAVEDLQEVSRGIHPSVLSASGLRPALRALARRSAVPVELDVNAGRLPERVEVAAYYVVSEALTNAAKHANASVVQVDVEPTNGVVRLSIRDDGVGGADPRRGSGLVGLGDRIEALGGELTITSQPGGGTWLSVTLPIDGD
jgi:signal transduction histidine kinase